MFDFIIIKIVGLYYQENVSLKRFIPCTWMSLSFSCISKKKKWSCD